MQTRAKGPGAGWSWLAGAVNLGRHNPKALFGAAALLMVVALVPSILQAIAAEFIGPQVAVWVAAVGVVLMVVVFPLMICGFLRVIDDAEHGRSTRALAVFDTFRADQDRGRIIGLGVLLFLIYACLIALVFGFAGREVLDWYLQVMAAAQSATPGTPPVVPPMPEGMGRVFALSLLVMMITGGLYAIGFGQVALNRRGVGGAMADAITGTLKNVLPLLVLTLLGLVGMIAAMLVLLLVLMVLFLVGNLVHPLAGLVLAVPVYVAFLVMLYVVMLGVMYFIWRDVCGPAESTPAPDNQFAA